MAESGEEERPAFWRFRTSRGQLLVSRRHKADKTGPLAGVPYDGTDSNNWDLYHFPAEPGDTGWYSNDPKWQQQWYAEIKQLVDDYHPDLLYSDGGVPFGNEVGLSQIANFYNGNLQHNHGKLTAVYNCKQESGGRWVQDYERGGGSGIDPYPWQNDTSSVTGFTTNTGNTNR